MHINLELLECAYLTCSMLLEIPAMAAAGSNPEARKKIISKPFRRMLDYNERQVFSGKYLIKFMSYSVDINKLYIYFNRTT